MLAYLFTIYSRYSIISVDIVDYREYNLIKENSIIENREVVTCQERNFTH